VLGRGRADVACSAGAGLLSFDNDRHAGIAARVVSGLADEPPQLPSPVDVIGRYKVSVVLACCLGD
jgi:hypothetical protein